MLEVTLLGKVRAAQKALCLPKTFYESKWAALLKVQMDAFTHNISSPSYFTVLTEGQAVTRAPFFFFFYCSSYILHPTPVAWINPHRLSTCNGPHTAQGHVHLFHFQQGPNKLRGLIWACRIVPTDGFQANQYSISMRGELLLVMPEQDGFPTPGEIGP